jgi:hypothetical protein
MNPISLVRLRKLLLPSPRSHWSATGPRSKTQPTATRNTERKPTRPSCWQPKPVRPVSETGQTASVGLSLQQARETGQTSLANRSGRFCPESPQNTFETKTTPKRLKKLSSFEQENPSHDKDSLAQKPFTTAHRAKPVRLVWETGQAGFA